jgi:hypothetical protein
MTNKNRRPQQQIPFGNDNKKGKRSDNGNRNCSCSCNGNGNGNGDGNDCNGSSKRRFPSGMTDKEVWRALRLLLLCAKERNAGSLCCGIHYETVNRFGRDDEF